MRLVFILGITFMSVTGAFAQARNEASSKAPTQDAVANEHPDWFREPNTYRPCPAVVTFHGRITCLGVGGR